MSAPPSRCGSVPMVVGAYDQQSRTTDRVAEHTSVAVHDPDMNVAGVG
jgi:hypothetical protein